MVSINKLKARLVAKSFHQIPGFDFQETFSPIVKSVTIHILLTLVLTHHWLVQQLDINNVFLNGTLIEDVYVTLLTKSLFGSFIDPYMVLNKLLELGMKSLPHFCSNFDLKRVTTILHCSFILFMDQSYMCWSMLMIFQSQTPLQLLSKTLFRNLVNSLPSNNLATFWVSRSSIFPNDSLLLNQTKYITNLLAKVDITNCNSINSPMVSNRKINSLGTDVMFDATLYRSTVGALQYAIYTHHTLHSIQCQ